VAELSPAAQAVLTAASVAKDHAQCPIAAALRAAVATGGLKTPGGGVILDGNFLLAIAAELEGPHG
jgi:hypothetical protein